jgi:hypothetical protein
VPQIGSARQDDVATALDVVRLDVVRLDVVRLDVVRLEVVSVWISELEEAIKVVELAAAFIEELG